MMTIEPFTEEGLRTVSQKYGLQPQLLKLVLVHRCEGLNNLQIAQLLRCNKNTVNAYVKKLRQMDRKDCCWLFLYTATETFEAWKRDAGWTTGAHNGHHTGSGPRFEAGEKGR